MSVAVALKEGSGRTMATDDDERKKGNVVDRAIDACGGSMTVLAERLERISGQHCSKQLVWNWKQAGQIPAHWVWPVYRLTQIPVDELLARTRKPKSKGNK